MEHYLNRGGNSSVAGFEVGEDYVRVAFTDGAAYLYTNVSAGATNIDRMKTLARAGHGLNSFINLNVKKRYARKEH